LAEDKNKVLAARMADVNSQMTALRLAATGVCPVLKESCALVSPNEIAPIVAPLLEAYQKAQAEVTPDTDLKTLRNVIKESERLQTQLATAQAAAGRLKIDGRSVINPGKLEEQLKTAQSHLESELQIKSTLQQEAANIPPTVPVKEEAQLSEVIATVSKLQNAVNDLTVKYHRMLTDIGRNKGIADELVQLSDKIAGIHD
jgi:hypothetical protein